MRSGARCASSPALGGALKSDGLEAPFVGRDRELRLIKELFHATRRRRPGAPRLGDRRSPGSASRGWRGSSTSTSTASSTRLVAPRPLPRLRRGRRLLGARRHGAHALPDRRGRAAGLGAGEAAATLHEHLLDPDERALRRAAARAAARPRGAVGADRQELFAAWRLFFERLADSNPSCWSSRTCSGRTRAARLHRVPARVVARPPALRAHARPARAARAPPGWGAGQRNFSSLYLEPLSRRRWRSSSRARARAARAAARPDPGARRGRAALRGRDRADAARPGPARGRTAPSTGRRARSRRSRCRRRCTR